MIKQIIPQIRKIFVGRQPELEQLDGLWEFCHDDVEHPIYVFLNAPGVGKSTLIDHFGKSIEAEEKGLFIKFICSSDYEFSDDLNYNLINILAEKIRFKKTLILTYIEQNFQAAEQKDWVLKKFEQLVTLTDNFAITTKPSIKNVMDVFIQLSRIIPVFFAADEIQELQKLTFNNKDHLDIKSETGLHFFSRILKNLLNSRLLIVLSGTRYHILSQIGGDLGSPIRQKVEPLIIQKFNEKEVNAYIIQVEKLIKSTNIESGINNLTSIIKNYEIFLFAFSGGHPRTMEKITNLFLTNLSILLNSAEYLNYEVFMNHLLPKAEEFFTNSLLSSVHKEALLNLGVSEGFSMVKKWLLNQASQGQFLGIRPQYTEKPKIDGEIRRIIYELMNIGIIVQNGNYKYHLIS